MVLKTVVINDKGITTIVGEYAPNIKTDKIIFYSYDDKLTDMDFIHDEFVFSRHGTNTHTYVINYKQLTFELTSNLTLIIDSIAELYYLDYDEQLFNNRYDKAISVLSNVEQEIHNSHCSLTNIVEL